MRRPVLIYLVTEDWYFCSHRMPIALAARDAGYDVVVVTRERDHGERIRRAGLRLIPLDVRRSGLNPFVDLLTIVHLTRLYRRERPLLVHHVAMKPVIFGAVAARLAGVPHVVSAFAGMGWLFSSKDGLARLLRPAIGRLLRGLLGRGIALVQNPDDADLLMKLGVEESRIRAVRGSGVDLRRFRPQPEPDGTPLVLLPGRLLKDKGIEEFVEAAGILRKRGIDARFMLAGQPDMLNPAAIDPGRVEAWVREGLVEHPGQVDDMPGLMARAAIVCLPSYREGLPLALAEAAASGRAIVTTDVPGCREVVRDGDNGLLVPPRDATALAGALERLLLNHDMRRRMGEQGRLRAEQEFGVMRVVSQTLETYRALTDTESSTATAVRELR